MTVEVVRNKLDGIANEMQSTLLRASFSPIVREGLDASASLFTIRGETLVQAVAIPNHLATMIPMMARILATFPQNAMAPGDIYTMNDPYLGGTHLPDIVLVMPVFAGGRIVAFAAAITHHQDVGGMSPGSIPTNATEIYQEGLRLPPLKLRRGFDALDEQLLAVMKLNSRIPEILMGDLNAQVSACTVGLNRVGELALAYGPELALAMFDDLLDRSERMTRAKLLAIPEGSYRYVDFNDNDGIDLDMRIRFEVTVTIRGGRFRCDFTGSSPQVRGPFNAVPSGALAAAYFALCTVIGPDVPTNGGCFRLVDLVVPKGSILNPVEPAPVNARTATIKRATVCVLGALRDVLPDIIGADAAGEMVAVVFGGKDAAGRRYVVGELIAGGSGAGSASDGVDVVETDATNCKNLPVESIERDAPIRVHATRLARDSGGPGMFRGGLGIHREYELLKGECSFTYRGERHYRAAAGAFGGQPGGLARAVIIRSGGRREEIPSKIVTWLEEGDRVILETAGGGGFGPAEQRAPERVMADIANRKVSLGAAQRHYGLQPAQTTSGHEAVAVSVT